MPEDGAVPESTDPENPPIAGETVGDDLPEWEPLSPELLEDEAIRGDFVLRWAVIGLAFLAGCTEILDARALVHVRIGEWLAAHGFLPPATDPFSLTAGDRHWINLSWLFDLISAGVHAIGGAAALSVVQGLLAAVTVAAISYACRPNIRTWWGSLCCALVILTAYPQWEWRPELITLLGTGWLCWILIGRESCARRPAMWLIPVGLWLWCQLDPRAWVGLWLLILYCLGQSLARRQDSQGSFDSPGRLWGLCGTAAGVMLIHPFVWHTWLAPLSQYLVEYPALRELYPRPSSADLAWYPLYADEIWNRIDHRLVAGLLLMTAALVSLLLNIRRAAASYWLWFCGANLLAILGTHELPFAAVVNCVIATVQGQDWYLTKFGQVYSVAWTEVLFSRGGRAATVVGFFGLAWVIVSGRLDGPNQHRTGTGLARSLQQDLEDLRRLSDVVSDDHGFHFTLRQGDALIAAGRKSYVDHRVALFVGAGDQDLLVLHDRARRTFRRSTIDMTQTELTETTAAALDRYEISHVLPRLSTGPVPPDYETFLDLMSSPSWVLADLKSTVGVFVRTGTPNGASNHRILNVVERAFRDVPLLEVEPRERILPPPWSQYWVSKPDTSLAAGTQLCGHWLRVVRAAPGAPLPFQISCSLLAIRAAQSGTRETPQLADAYHALAQAYRQLLRLETLPLAGIGVPWSQSMRYYQAISAVQQAALLDPQNAGIQLTLVDLAHDAGKADVAYEALQRFLELTEDMPDPSDVDLAQREALEALRGRLIDVIGDNDLRVDAALEQQVDRLQIAFASHQAGCLNRAIQLLQDDAIYVEQNPLARLQLTAWLAERGDGLDLDDSTALLERIGPQVGIPTWHDSAAYAALGRADYAAAIEDWQQEVAELNVNRATSLLITMPMATTSPLYLGDARYPLSHLIAIQEATTRQAFAVAATEWQRAMCELERGNVEGARQGIRRALDCAPDSYLRPLLRLYWFCLTEEMLDPEPPYDWIPIEHDTFAAEAAE